MTPTPPRLLNVDALRGFALLGILTVNIWSFADPWYATAGANPAYTSRLDLGLRGAITLLFETKFYLLFAFLFGYSVTLQMDAAARAGTAFLPRMLRRQAGLLTLGVLHGVLLYNGDIMWLYALLGLPLLACRNWPPRSAAWTGIGLVLVAAAAWLVLGTLAWMAGDVARETGLVKSALAKLADYSSGAVPTLLHHVAYFPETAAAIAMLQGTSALAMFFLGFAAGRARLLEQPQRVDGARRRVLALGLPLGLAGAGIYTLAAHGAPGTAQEIFAYGISQATAPLLTASYAIGLLWLFDTAAGRRLQQALAPLGKMALSNYVGQSLLLNLLFTGYGLGWTNRLPTLAVLAWVPIIYAGQMAFSAWWLRRHAYGPGEWLLRAMTTASLPRWRRCAVVRPE